MICHLEASMIILLLVIIVILLGGGPLLIGLAAMGSLGFLLLLVPAILLGIGMMVFRWMKPDAEIEPMFIEDKPCVECQRSIQRVAKRCRYCGATNPAFFY